MLGGAEGYRGPEGPILSTIHNPHRQSTIRIVQCAIDNLQSKLCNVRSTTYNPSCAMCDRQPTIQVVQCAIDNRPRSKMCERQCTYSHGTELSEPCSDDCRTIVFVEPLQLYSDCASLLRPLRRSHGLCVL